jgi:hypothetical protein
MGRRKQSDINRTANFGKGDEDRPTKRLKIGHHGLDSERASRKENQPARQMLTGRHSDDRRIPLPTMRRFANRSHRFMDAYSHGLNGRQAVWATKKYRGHRTLPHSIMDELEKANIV